MKRDNQANWLLLSAIIIFNLISALQARIISSNTDQIQEIATTKVDSLLYPNEILPIKPLLLYPSSRSLQFKKHKDSKVIYIRLLTVSHYHPRTNNKDDYETGEKFQIYYVKALVNGKFDDQHIKQYRLPEFYEIRIYHKPKLADKDN